MKRFIAYIILLGDFERVPPLSFDFFRYYWGVISTALPVVIISQYVLSWFHRNGEFWAMLFFALTVNGIIGAYSHWRFNTFSAKIFVFRNFEMGMISGISYIMLDILGQIAGEGLASGMFRILIQLSTILYPISKIFKNIFLISRGKHPPEFIMRRLYNFEKNGDLSRLFETEGGDSISVEEDLQKLKEEVLKRNN